MSGRTLHYFIQKKATGVVRILLSEGVDVNKGHTDEEGFTSTPLQLAVITRNKKMAAVLISAKADVHAKNNMGHTALQLALDLGDFDVIKILILAGADDFDKNVKGPNTGRTPLHSAAEGNDVWLVERLIVRGAEVNIKDANYQTPLHLAMTSNEGESHFNVMETLLKKEADVDSQDRYGKSTLHYFERWTSDKIINLLLRFEANVNLVDGDGNIPLVESIYVSNVEAVRQLVEHGSSVVKINTITGSTPLHYACCNCRKNICKYLLLRGADVDTLDFQGRSPLMHLLESQNNYISSVIDMLKFLLKYADVNTIGSTKGDIPTNPFTNGEIWKIILEHFAILKAVNLPVSTRLLNDILSEETYKNYFANCTDELMFGKRTKLKNSWVNFFNLLVDGKKNLKNYGGNEDLVADCKKFNFNYNFPIFGSRMRKNITKGIKRRELFDKSTVLLSDCIPIFNSTHLIIRDTLDCGLRTMKDLNKFCE